MGDEVDVVHITTLLYPFLTSLIHRDRSGEAETRERERK
jgi:hypothetical protein